MYIRFCFIISFTVGSIFTVVAQAPDNWFNLDPRSDKANGVSSEKAYTELLQNMTPQTVVVAVIDGGVDPLHEDLKRIMWINEDEIPDNGIDDDKNGYVDDIYGWNFIGGKDGENVHYDTYELTRIVAKMDGKYNGVDTSSMTKSEKEDYKQYLAYKENITSAHSRASEKLSEFTQILDYINMAMSQAELILGNKSLSKVDMESLADENPMVANFLQQILSQMGGTYDGSVADLKILLESDFEQAIDQEKSKVDYGYNIEFDPRDIIEDNYEQVDEIGYGNNDVKGPDAFHGTHVAGIIAADRLNDLGIKGVANNVRIMAIRAVPDGDERDKDVANAIRYAVDNGASIINMSFGKGFSPREIAVEEAMRYAEKNDVLMIHAAGNASQNNDIENNFPNAKYDVRKKFLQPKQAKKWVEVGATEVRMDEEVIADFSNYGQNSVDIFAPGHNIYSTAPDNTYEYASGTSMAAPVVSGVAAVLRSYFPKLKAKKIKKILIKSARPITYDVLKPGAKSTVDPAYLAKNPAIVNLYEAIKMAK